MKKTLSKLILLTIPFLLVGCVPSHGESVPSGDTSATSGKPSATTPSENPSVPPSTSSQQAHTHTWSTDYAYDDTNHWHYCIDCGAKSGIEPHQAGEVGYLNPVNDGLTKYPNPKKGSMCSTCGQFKPDGNDILPQIRFTFDPNDPDADFMTKATKSDLFRPTVNGTLSVTNCASQYEKSNLNCGMKVRGNQTAGWSKKGFSIKFDKATVNKTNLLGLNGGKKYRKWILLADAKDTCLVRSALGLFISKAVIHDGDNVWAADFCPVELYLNDQYWGYYYLAEQKEVKSGRIMLPEPEDLYTGVDIGYCFELDHYADAQQSDEASEVKKGKDGDPTFKVTYSPKMVTGNVQGALAAGGITTYTILSDITDGPRDENGDPTVHLDQTNSNQVAFMKDRLEKLYTILYEAAINNKAKEINEDTGAVVNSSKTVKEVITQYFDLKAWADGIIINAFSCPPDLGYSSFYMSYDNSPTGDKRLRFDVPWDFDSNFGNRNGFITNGNENVYVDRTHNMWIQLFYKLNFFVDEYVKVRWNLIREEQAFELMFKMMRTYFNDYDKSIQKNHTKWPQNDAAHQPPNNFDEIRNPYKNPSQYKEAEEETFRWCSTRVNYLESLWGTGRPNVNTGA